MLGPSARKSLEWSRRPRLLVLRYSAARGSGRAFADGLAIAVVNAQAICATPTKTCNTASKTGRSTRERPRILACSRCTAPGTSVIARRPARQRPCVASVVRCLTLTLRFTAVLVSLRSGVRLDSRVALLSRCGFRTLTVVSAAVFHIYRYWSESTFKLPALHNQEWY